MPREDMHHCLGCDPCLQAEQYVEYIRSKKRLDDLSASEQPSGSGSDHLVRDGYVTGCCYHRSLGEAMCFESATPVATAV